MSTRLGTLTLDLVARIGSFTQGMRHASTTADREMGRVRSSVVSADDMLKKLAVTAGATFSISQVVNYADSYTGLVNRLKLVTDSQSELNVAVNDTFDIAQKTASSWDSAAMVYQRFAENADRLGISMKTTAELTETVSKAISISGGSAASAEAALMQFGQALASGVLRGEEFNSIAEQAPGLLKAIAFGLDTNVGELRAMAGEGKITGDVLVDALGKAKPYIDDLFNKTDFTIAQSFTRLSNEVTKYIGEAGSASGATKVLSESITLFAENLGAVANVAMIGGVALLTKMILGQTIAVQGSIAATIERRAADALALQSQIQLAAVEVHRMRQVTALALTEINLARQELNSATTRQARTAATMRLTQAEIAHRLALHQTTAATAAQTAAETALNATRSRGVMLLGLVGGPIGAITLGVTALAAGYLYLKNRTAEANAKLEEQGRVALETDENLKKLSGNDKISAVNNLTAAFNDQNKKLAESKASVDAVLFSIRAASVENEKARKVTEDAKNGIISYDEAIKRLNNMNIPTDLYDMLKKQVIQYDENAEKASKSQHALGLLGKAVELAGNLFQNSAVQVAGNTKELNANEAAAQKAAEAQDNYAKSLADKRFSAEFTNRALSQGLSEDKTAAALDAALYARKAGVKLTTDMVKQAYVLNDVEQKNKAIVDARNKAISDGNKASLKSQRDAAAQAKRDAKEAERLQDQRFEEQKRILYEYSTGDSQQKMDLESEIQRLTKNGMSDFIPTAKARFDAEQRLIKMKFEFDLAEHLMTEEQKLKFSNTIKQQEIMADAKLSKDQRAEKIKSLQEVFNQETAAYKRTQQTQLLEAKRHWVSAEDYARDYYALIREEILATSSYSPEMKQALVKEANFNQGMGENADREQVWGDYKDRFGLGDSPYQQDMDLLAEARAQMLITEEEYFAARTQLAFASSSDMIGNMTDLMGSLLGEQSEGYKAMFAVQKAFAIAEILMNAPKSYSKAFDAMIGIPYVGPVLAPIAGGVAIAAQLAQAASVKSISLSGMAHDGIDNIPKEGTWLLDKGERVVDSRTNADLKGLIAKGGNGGVTVNVNVPQGYTGRQSTDANGNVTIDVVKQEIAGAFNNIGRPNSSESRAIQSAFGLAPAR